MKKKKAFTLLEIMIVIFLIGLIGSIIGYSMKGSLDEGKAFKTEQAIIRMRDLLEMEIAKGSEVQQVADNYKAYLKATGIIKNVDNLCRDGWKNEIQVTVESNELKITSDKLNAFREKKKALRGYDDYVEEDL